MHVWCSSFISKIATPRVISWQGPHSRRKTDGRVSASHVDLVCDIDAGLGQTDGWHDPTTTAASKTLPCKLADIRPADRIRASETPGEGGIVRMSAVCCIRASISSDLRWEETGTHPGQGVEEDMPAIGSC